MTTPRYSADKYTYRVLWSDESRQYVGVCSEFPEFRYLAEMHDAALAGIINRVDWALEAGWKACADLPVPLAIQRFKEAK